MSWGSASDSRRNTVGDTLESFFEDVVSGAILETAVDFATTALESGTTAVTDAATSVRRTLYEALDIKDPATQRQVGGLIPGCSANYQTQQVCLHTHSQLTKAHA